MTIERVDVGPWTLAVERPESAEPLIDEDAFARDEFLPYWAELWPSAIALARHVATRDLRGRRALELGCGLGLTAIAAARAGARVLATDWADDALVFTQLNAARNATSVETALLVWGRLDALEELGSFDLVLAADVLYEARHADPLLSVLDRALAPGGEALVADPGRQHAAAFLEAAHDARWHVATTADATLPRGGVHRLWRDRHESGT